MSHVLAGFFGWACVVAFWGYAYALDRQAARRVEDRDSAWFWARMLGLSGAAVAVWSSLSFAAAYALKIDPAGGRWHQVFIAVFGAPQPHWLAVLIAMALAAIAAELIKREHPDPWMARWIAGSIDSTTRRTWVAAGVLVFGIPWLWAGLFGSFPYSSGLWMWEAVFLVSLWRISRTKAVRKESTIVIEAEIGITRERRNEWAPAMADLGIDLTPLSTFRPGEPARPPEAYASDWAELVKSRGAAMLAPEVLEQIFLLVHSKPDAARGAPLLMLGLPEDCGETETTATAAGELALNFAEATLLIVPKHDDLLLARLRKWSGLAPSQVQEVTRRFDLSSPPGIWVVDAATLSDWLMENLVDSAFASTIGMVVWWNLHEYTGVYAANLWAISRRLDRLLRERGRVGVRTLVTVRQSAYGEAQETAFVQRLLPYPFTHDSIVQVEPRVNHEQRLYLISGHKRYFEKGAHSEILNKMREAPLVAARASVESKWSTFLYRTPTRVSSDWENFLRLQLGSGTVGAALSVEPQMAGAQIRQIEPGEALALKSIFSNGGRSDAGGDHHCVGIIPPENPYVAFVLRKYSRDGTQVEASRRMVGSEGNPAIYDRHLLLALNEMRDTETNLTRALVWNQDAIRRTLHRHREQLQTEEVAYLSPGGDSRQIEDLYTLKLPRHDDTPPLDTVGSRRDLVEVREPSGGETAMGVRMIVDAERLLIKAYPDCVFYCNGVRYRVDDWIEPEDRTDWWVPCHREGAAVATWRLSWPEVRSIQPEQKGRWRIGGSGYVLECGAANVTYQEKVEGYLNREYNLTDGTFEDRSQRYHERETSFDTKGLLLSFHASPDKPDVGELDAWALALRHVLPVHLGIESDAIEMVTVHNMRSHDNDLLLGIAIVDLYPGAIGLVEALLSDHQILTRILRATAEWLRHLREQAGHAFESPIAAIWGNLDMCACLPLLETLLDHEQPARRGAART